MWGTTARQKHDKCKKHQKALDFTFVSTAPPADSTRADLGEAACRRIRTSLSEHFTIWTQNRCCRCCRCWGTSNIADTLISTWRFKEKNPSVLREQSKWSKCDAPGLPWSVPVAPVKAIRFPRIHRILKNRVDLSKLRGTLESIKTFARAFGHAWGSNLATREGQ